MMLRPARSEAIQVAAMALRYVLDLCETKIPAYTTPPLDPNYMNDSIGGAHDSADVDATGGDGV